MAHPSRFLVVFAALALPWALGCHHKRPPALAGATGAPMETASPAGAESYDSTTPGTAEDLQPVGSEGTMAEDFPAYEGQGESSPLEDVRFGYDSDSVGEDAISMVRNHATWLREHSNVKVTIEGHCDERGTVDYNLALGQRRATAVHDQLVALGIASSRLRTVSLGKERPLDPASNEAAWAKNRRAHFLVSPGVR